MTRIAPLLAVALVAAACGDDSDTSSGSGGASASSTSSPSSTSDGTGTGTGDTGTGPGTGTGSTGTGTGTGGGGTGGQGTGGAPACDEPDAPGSTFTFTFHNETALDIALPMGCGSVPYITISDEGGTADLHPEGADFCGNLCDFVLEGNAPQSCSDCGPGASLGIAPGEVATFAWDRRAYVTATIPAACSGLAEDASCAFGTTLTEGLRDFVVEVCSDTGGDTGMCSTDRFVDVTLDVSLDGADVVIAAE